MSAKLLNAVNKQQQAQVIFTVTDAAHNVLFTSTPMTTTLNVLTTLTSVDLGSFDTTGFALGTDTIMVTVTDLAGTPLPGATGIGSVLIGTPVIATLTTSPTTLPSGDSTVSTTLQLHDQGTTVGSSTVAIVPGSADPYLAGMPNGSTASIDDSAPGQSPVLVSGLTVAPGDRLSFSVAGSTGQQPNALSSGPDGDLSSIAFHTTGAENGISDTFAPLNSLMGVFLGPDQPNGTPAPAMLDFRSFFGNVPGGVDYTSLSPLLKQVFFIGDGLTSQGVLQNVVVPAGATRLFLGTMDGFEWSNNVGQLQVVVASHTPLTKPLGVVGQTAISGSTSVAVNGNLAYVGTSSGINIVDVTDPANPVVLSSFGAGQLPAGQPVGDLQINNGNQLVVLTSNFNASSLLVYSLANPTSPSLLGQTPLTFQGQVITGIGGISISNNHVFTSALWYRYFIFTGQIFGQFGESLDIDISDPAAPTVVSAVYNKPPDPTHVYPDGLSWPDGSSNVWQTAAVNDNVLLAGTTTATRDVTTGVSGQVLVVDTSNSNAPSVLETLTIPGMAVVQGIAVAGNRAFLLGSSQYWGPGTAGIQGQVVVGVLDLTNPQAPTILSTQTLNVASIGQSFLYSLGNNLFVTDSVAGPNFRPRCCSSMPVTLAT